MTIGSLGMRGLQLDEMKEAEWREDARIARQILEDKLGAPNSPPCLPRDVPEPAAPKMVHQ
jgi:hypothetical protein